MPTLFLTDEPVVESWLAERRAKGLDGRDEVWEGVYHVAPYEHARNGRVATRLSRLLQARADVAGIEDGRSFNLGEPGDFRVPDLGYHRTPDSDLYMPTAALVVEVLSPGDETFAKLGFYAAHGVDEVWMLDPVARTVEIRELTASGYARTDRSGLLSITAAEVSAALRWP